MAERFFEIPGRRALTLADLPDITGDIGDLARHALRAGYIDNTGKPSDYTPEPEKVGWLAWHWRYEVDGELVAEGNAWRKKVAYRRQHKAYVRTLKARAVAPASDEDGCK